MPEATLADEMDAENRMVSATPLAPTGGSLRVVNLYDYRNRRICKEVEAWVPQGPGYPLNPSDAAHWETVRRYDFVYDGWLPILETVTTYAYGVTATTEEIGYIWGRDLSGALQGAGGVGGLLAVLMDGQYYFPAYDNLGNVTEYLDESGSVVARYRYGAFGELLTAEGPLSDSFHLLFSTKYLDPETELYYYGERFYSPVLGRWLNRDPIGEEGGDNLYWFCRNAPIIQIDPFGKNIYLVTGNNTINPINNLVHQSICVDTWARSLTGCRYRNGKRCFSFGWWTGRLALFQAKSSWLGWQGWKNVNAPGIFMQGIIYELDFTGTIDHEKETTICEDMEWLLYMQTHRLNQTDVYSVLWYNCRMYSQNEFNDAPGRIIK